MPRSLRSLITTTTITRPTSRIPYGLGAAPTHSSGSTRGRLCWRRNLDEKSTLHSAEGDGCSSRRLRRSLRSLWEQMERVSALEGQPSGFPSPSHMEKRIQDWAGSCHVSSRGRKRNLSLPQMFKDQ